MSVAPPSTPDRFEQWAIVELFGHQKIAGLITEQAIGGNSFIRVDVPAFDDSPALTKLFTQGAIYGISFVSEQIARGAARSYRVAPVNAWDLRQIAEKQPSLLKHDDDDDDEGHL